MNSTNGHKLRDRINPTVGVGSCEFVKLVSLFHHDRLLRFFEEFLKSRVTAERIPERH